MDAVHLDLRYGSAECWMEPVTYALDLHICGGRKPLELNSSHIPVTSYQVPSQSQIQRKIVIVRATRTSPTRKAVSSFIMGF